MNDLLADKMLKYERVMGAGLSEERRRNAMRYGVILVVCMMLFLSGISLGNAEMMPIEPGTVKAHDSSNGAFQARVSYGENGMASLGLFKLGDSEYVWSEHLDGQPGRVAVSDNGKAVVMTTFGWEDEGGSNGLVIYNEKGAVVKKVDFGGEDAAKAGLKWVNALEVSPDGKFIAVGEGRKKVSRVTVYDAATGAQLWMAEGGYHKFVGISFGSGLERTILVTRNDESAMMFLLLDKAGKILGTKMLKKNFSYDVPVYARFGENGKAEVFDLKSGVFVPAKF